MFGVNRWVVVGVVAAVSAAAGGFGLVNAGTGRNLMTAVAPCRLLDTRASSVVGTRSTPLGAGETMTVRAVGTNGNCADIALGAEAITIQLTSVDATADSFLAAYPAELTTRPEISQLNTRAGVVISNSPVVALSPSGEFKLYNQVGSTNVIVDILGVYTPTTDSGQPGPAGPAGPAGPTGPQGAPGAQGPAGVGTLTVTTLSPSLGGVTINATSATNTLFTHTVTGAVTYTTTNRAAGRTVRVRVLGGAGGPHALTFPGWTWVGGSAPTTIANGATALLTVTFLDGTDATAIATWDLS